MTDDKRSAERVGGAVADMLGSWDPRMPIETRLFTDPVVHRAELERIFHGNCWHIVGHVSEFGEEGAYKLHRLGEVPLIVLRVQDGVRAFVNSCPHRGAQVVRGTRGKLGSLSASFKCIYHSWVYNAEGSASGVGRRQGYPDDFPMGEHCLPRASVALVGGVIFASLGKNPPAIDDYLGRNLVGHLNRLYGSNELQYLGVQRAIFQCNWKLYVENIYDSYHAVTLHKGFKLMRLRKAAPQIDDSNILRFGHYLSEYEVDLPDRIQLANPEIFEMRSRSDGVSSHLISNIFPASQLSQQLEVLALRCVVPRGVEATEIQFHVYGRKGDAAELREHQLWQAANFLGPQGLINLEDAAALARLQVSMRGRSREFDGRGGLRFPARRADEKAIDNFYGAYRRVVFESQSDGGAA